MLFDQQNFANCKIIGRYSYHGGRKPEILLCEVQGIVLHYPEGRREQVQQDCSSILPLLRSCTEFYLEELPVSNAVVDFKRKKAYILCAGEKANHNKLISEILAFDGESEEFMRNALKQNGGIISYWDSQSVAIVCDDQYIAEKLLAFMKKMDICYNPVSGLVLCRIK